MRTPETLPMSALAADAVVGTGRSSALSLATVIGSFNPDVGSVTPVVTTVCSRSV
jgi:hypothetical protein